MLVPIVLPFIALTVFWLEYLMDVMTIFKCQENSIFESLANKLTVNITCRRNMRLFFRTAVTDAALLSLKMSSKPFTEDIRKNKVISES